MNDILVLNNYLKEWNLELSKDQLDKFYKYFELLVSWNEKMNLTSITEFPEVIEKHFVDCLGLIKGNDTDVINRTISGEKVSLIDVGCGAGFPSIPLKIAFPNIKVTMLDSLNKRVNFLNEVIKELSLTDIEAVHGRAEDFAKEGMLREKYDIAVSRAVANLTTLSEYCLPYVKKSGVFVAYKSESLKEEVKDAGKAIHILGGEIEKNYEYTLPLTDYYRTLCVIRKKGITPKKYPRKAGLPSKEPIK